MRHPIIYPLAVAFLLSADVQLRELLDNWEIARTASPSPITINAHKGEPFGSFHGSDAHARPNMRLMASPQSPRPAAGRPRRVYPIRRVSLLFCLSTDGNVVATSANSCADFSSIMTNSFGDIAGWDIRQFTPCWERDTCTGAPLPLEFNSTLNIDIASEAPSVINFATSPIDPAEWIAIASPEPATWAMLLVGFLGLGAVMRLRFRNGVKMPKFKSLARPLS